MNFFQPLDGYVLLRNAGIFSEHQIYHHQGELFARKGNGYLRLMDHHATSKSKVFWSDIRLSDAFEVHIGKLTLSTHINKPIRKAPRKKAA